MRTQGKNWRSKLGKASIMVMGAAMTMGNQKCEQKPEEQGRSLKKIIEMGSMQSSKIQFPDGSYFDFQFVANQQIYSVLLDTDKFTFKMKPPITTSPENVADGNDSALFSFSNSDKQMMKSFSHAAGKGNLKAQLSKTAWCMVNVPQAKLSGSVNAFELIGGGGLSLGFNSGGSHSSGISGLGFDVSWAQLDLSMYARYPLSDKVLAGAHVTSKQTKTKVSFALNFGAFAVGPSAYYQTPLARVTENALKKAVDDISVGLANEEWYTRVILDLDTHIMIVGGRDVGLKTGDQLLVYNEEITWDGEPCNSAYRGSTSSAGSAVAKIEIDSVGDEISRGRVIEQNDFTPEIGAKVKLFKFRAGDYVEEQPGVDNGVSLGSPSTSGSSSGSSSNKAGRG